MEPNDNQGINSKKSKNFNSSSLVVTSKIIGIFRLPSFREGLLITFCFILLIALLQLHLSPHTSELKVGQASKIEVIAPRDVIDREATKRSQQEAVDRALEIARQDLDYYIINDSIMQKVVFNLTRFFETIEQERKNYQAKQSLNNEDISVEKFKSYFYEPPSADLLGTLLTIAPEKYQELKIKSLQFLNELESTQRIDDQSLSKVKFDLPQTVLSYTVSSDIYPIFIKLAEISIRPNLILNATKISKLENQIRMEVPDVIHHQNELLITKNQVITENDLKMLQELHFIVDKSSQITVFLSLALFVLFLIGLCWIYIFQFHAKLFKQERLLYLLLLLLLLIVGLIKVISLSGNFAFSYLAPVSFVAMLITILIDPQLALAMTIIISLLGGIIVEYNLALTIFYFISGVVAVLTLANFHRQRDLVRCGSILMITNAGLAIILNLLFRVNFNYMSVVFATTNGFLSAVLAIGSLPFLEHIFRITSPIRLLELSNPGHPLLRRLQIEAPGTYQHSLMVGNLAEAAAEGIGADALWARVGSYYHDIGKIRRPYFFVENQFSQENPHEKLNPTLSTLIITYHVKEGAEIAREHGLPDKLIDIIEQHHGTDLVRYFYKRATENLQAEKEILSQEDFRYEGPKPQTKEAALVMLADSVEAAVKSLPKPTPSKIETLIQKIFRERLDDGQFDECNLTLKDLNNIKNSFIKVLGGLFHNRIEYPENVLKEIERKKMNGDSGK